MCSSSPQLQKNTFLFFIKLVSLAVISTRLLRTRSNIWRPNRDSFPPRNVSDAIDVNVYLIREQFDVFNPALSVFRTDVLQRYGTGRMKFVIHERAECNKCNIDEEAHPLLAFAPCLAVGRFRSLDHTYCTYEHLRCTYPHCKTMVTNDEMCDMINLPFDVRQYYTTNGPQRGYLPLGPQLNSWLSFQKIKKELGHSQFVITPSSERKYAFNAVFSRSTNVIRQQMAHMIEVKGPTLKFPFFSSIAHRWSAFTNNNNTEQLHTDEYIRVVLDSVFTLSPAGHNPECFRLYEAIEAGSIPILTQDDLRGNYRPDDLNSNPHPCANSLLHWYGAPIVVLDSWDDLFPTVERLLEDPVVLNDMQSRLRNWYNDYMHRTVAKFEDSFLG
ncbi:hypothetical protein ACHAW5_005114 [Stephanodiscus triporus]|uniref:RXYLT1 C-terminal domain-containing protein n=2 Tax=Stephanodiscus triporus TaxID=2934178 RepID=A0ABD3PNP5_9STRA